MVDLKEYFYNTNHYSDSIITKFIYDFTDKFNPFLLLVLNKEFVLGYLSEMGEMNEWKVKKEFDFLENLIDKEELKNSTSILCRMYSYSDGVYKIEEVFEEYYNLNYSEHMEMTKKIQDFQYCMHKIILWLNSNKASTYNQQPTIDQSLTGKPEQGFNRNNLNKNAHELFTYLDENYEKNGNIKFINIFKFLKKVDKRTYAFNFTEEKYRNYIFDLNGVKITNFSTATFGYDDKEFPILNALEEDFRKRSSN